MDTPRDSRSSNTEEKKEKGNDEFEIDGDLVHAFKRLGCDDEDKCAVASFVYMDLKEVKVEDLETLYDRDLDLIYFRGSRNGTPELLVPIPVGEEMDMLQFEEVQRRLSGDIKCVTMAICEPTSTILYYSIINGFMDK